MERDSSAVAVAVVLLCLSAGCTDLRWHRSGSDTAALEHDLMECRGLARAEAAHLSWPFPDNRTRVVSVDRFGRGLVTPYPYPTALDADRLVLQSERIGACMRDRGYVLAPSESHARP